VSSKNSYYGLDFHIQDPNFLVSTNFTEGLQLWDLRFSKRAVWKTASSQKTVSTKISPNGKKIITIRKGEYPVVYDFSGAIFKTLDELDTFSTNATIKDPCWISEDLVACGSDDHGLYFWNLRNSEKSYVKYFHKSIINQLGYCRKRSVLFSSGIEKYVTIWRRSRFMGSDDSERKRRVFNKSEVNQIFSAHNAIRMQQEDANGGDYREDDVMSFAMFDFAVERTRNND